MKGCFGTLGEKTGKNHTLSLAGGAFSEYLNWIESLKLFKIADYINLLEYELYVKWSKATGSIKVTPRLFIRTVLVMIKF